MTGNLFNDPASYRIVLDLLFDERMYGEVIECYAEVKARAAAQPNSRICNSAYAILAATYYRLVCVYLSLSHNIHSAFH